MEEILVSKDSLFSKSASLLVVDDERVIRDILKDFLELEGFSVDLASDGDEAIHCLRRDSYQLLITDLKMPGINGLELLKTAESISPDTVSIMMTGFATVEAALSAMKAGAFDVILKPFSVDELLQTVRRGLEKQRLHTENMRLRQALSLYQTSAAISQSLSVDHILDLLVDTGLREFNADCMTLMLDRYETGRFDRHRIQTTTRRSTDYWVSSENLEVNMDLLVRRHLADESILVHGADINAYIKGSPSELAVTAFCSIPLIASSRLLGVLNAFSFNTGHVFREGQRKMLSIICDRTAVSLENARLYEKVMNSNSELEALNLSLEENFRQTIVGFANALEESDRYTRGHSERVSIYARLIAEGMGLDQPLVDRVVFSARIHDIGKIGIPTEKLNKVGKLTVDEMALLRSHPEKGKRILDPVPFLRDLVPGAYSHHERYDGKGYPLGLSGEQIPLLGRIIAVADAYDAMTTDRAYRRALSRREATRELFACAGSQFDENIVNIFIKELGQKRTQTEEEVLMAVI